MSASQDNLPPRGHPPQLIQMTLGRWVPGKTLIERQYLYHACDECPSVCTVVVTVTVMGFGIREALFHTTVLPLPT